MIRYRFASRFLFATVCGLLFSHSCLGEVREFRFDNLSPTSYLDRWLYPFNQTPGARIQAPTFGTASGGFDERDGQMVLAVNTVELGFEADLPEQRYRVHSATLTLTETSGNYSYDPTYDSYTTYLDPAAAAYTDDEDFGRPIELYGVGFRGDYTEFSWTGQQDLDPPGFASASPFGPVDSGTRNVFAVDATGRDVSNNADILAGGVNGFDPTPFAVARMFTGDVDDGVELEPEDTVNAGTQWSFTIDVSDPDIQSYLARSLAVGQLGFAVTSMHDAGVLGTGEPFPNPATADHFAWQGPVLRLDVEILDDVPGVLGDFDGDELLTAQDIDLLSAAVREVSANPSFDLTSDGVVDEADRVEWVRTGGIRAGRWQSGWRGVVSRFPLTVQRIRSCRRLGGRRL